MSNLPPRISTAVVCELAGYGHTKLRQRIKSGKMPKPVDRGRDGYIFLTADVEKALGIGQEHKTENPFEAALNETRTA